MNARQLPWDTDAIEAMGPVVEASPWAAVAGLRDTLGQAHLWELTQGRAQVLLALRGVQCEHGRVLDVVGMRSLGDRVDAGTLSEALERIAHTRYAGVDLLSMQTAREHLQRGCERQGWRRAGVVMTKNLRLQ